MSDSDTSDSDIEESMDMEGDETGENLGEELLSDSNDSDSVNDGNDANEDEDIDDDDDDDDEDDENKLIAKYLEILGQISDDKYNYDNYVELVDVSQ